MKRFEGNNLEEALDKASKDLGVPSYDLKYSVVSEKRGFLGGVKRVVIEAEASPKSDEAPRPKGSGGGGPRRGSGRKPANRPSRQEGARRPARQEKDDEDGWVTIGPAGEDESPEEEAPERKREEPRRPRPQGRGPKQTDEKKGRPKKRGRGGRGRRRDNGEKKNGEKKQDVSSPVVEAPEQGEQSDGAREIAEWCGKVFELAGLELVARTTENDEEIRVELYGADVELTQKHGGELLDSIQVLVNKAQVGRSLEQRIELDCSGFKKERNDRLTEKATRVAEAVREEGREQALGSMTPIERRIVHVTVEDIDGVTTESRGRGFHKRVVILPDESEESERVAAVE